MSDEPITESDSFSPLPDNPEDVGATPSTDVPERGRAGGKDLLLAVILLWGLQVLTIIVLVLAMASSGGGKPGAGTILVVALIDGMATVALTTYFVCKKYGHTFAMGFSLTRPDTKTLATTIGLGVLLAIAAQIVLQYFGTGESPMVELGSTVEGHIVISILAILLPVVEEMYYRGFIFPVLRGKLGVALAIILTTVWFTVPHCMQLWGEWVGIPVIAAVGVLLVIQRHVTGSLTAPILTHLSYNTVLIAMSWIVADGV